MIELSSEPAREPYGVAVCIAGGACPATELVGHEIIQSNMRFGNDVYILHDGLNSLLHGTEPEKVERHKESYVSDLMGEASRDFIGGENGIRAAENLHRLTTDFGIRALYAVGGDGTAAGLQHTLDAYPAGKEKPSVYLAPKTIDGDVKHSDTTVGHATAVFKVDEMIHAARHDSLKMKRALFVQVPGRDAGHLALKGGEGHADIILIKEAPFHPDVIHRSVEDIYRELRYCIIAVAEGFEPMGVQKGLYKYADATGNNGRSTIAEYLASSTRTHMRETFAAMQIPESGKPVNSMVIPSEILRGARPVQQDRDLASDLGRYMSRFGQEHAQEQQAYAFVVREDVIVHVPLRSIADGYKSVSEKDYWPGGIYINHHKQPL